MMSNKNRQKVGRAGTFRSANSGPEAYSTFVPTRFRRAHRLTLRQLFKRCSTAPTKHLGAWTA
jgi:hypothetical protein